MAVAPSSEESAREDARWVETILARGSTLEAEACYAHLMRKYWKLVNVLAVSKLGDPRDAEDVAQEAFLRAFRSLDRLAQPVAFLGWLLKITRNLITDRIRSRRPSVSLDAIAERAGLGTWDPGERGPDVTERLETAEEVERVLEAVAALPEKYREAVALRYLQGLDGKTMAELLGEPEGTVRNRLFRALQKLRSAMEGRKARIR